MFVTNPSSWEKYLQVSVCSLLTSWLTGKHMQDFQTIFNQNADPISFYDVCFELIVAADGLYSFPTKQDKMLSPRELMVITRQGNSATSVKDA